MYKYIGRRVVEGGDTPVPLDMHPPIVPAEAGSNLLNSKLTYIHIFYYQSILGNYQITQTITHRAYLLVREYLYLRTFLSTMFWDIFSLTKRHKIQI